jgi:predicted GTPase
VGRGEGEELSRARRATISTCPVEEQTEVAAQLNEINELLVQTHQADRAALESRIDYLIDASTRISRRDWLNIFMGIFSMA